MDELNLNDKTPVVVHFATWAGGVARGDFGKTVDGDPVAVEMVRRMGVSVWLLLLGSILGGMLEVYSSG